MLMVNCEKCNKDGNALGLTGCNECNGYGEKLVEKDVEKTAKVYVNAYKMTREFGGHEEGGWYYNRLKCLESVPCKNEYSKEISEDLEEEYSAINRGDISSVLGGAKLVILTESRPCESETREKPRYE